MIFKVVTLFLVVMAVLAMFGRLRLPGTPLAAKCRRCGAPRAGRGPCPCGKG